MHTISKKNDTIIVNDDLKNEVSADWFEQSYWLNQGRLLGANSGRGSAWVIKSEWGKWVLRHYFRGGLYAKINRDSYLWSGLKNTRAYREYMLLEKINSLGLPSAQPIAAKITRHGLMYRNDLIMAHIPHDLTFAEAIGQETYSKPNIWQQIGHTIAQFHHNGIYHSDLNAHNILLSNNQVYLIDFDKGQVRTPHPSWQQANMMRLKRSIEKISTSSCDGELAPLWQSLMQGYDA